MKYRSKAHTVKAFKFTGLNVEKPKWFTKAIEHGRVSVTAHPVKSYVTIYKGENYTSGTRADFGDWIVLNEQNNIFALTDAEFHSSFTPQLKDDE